MRILKFGDEGKYLCVVQFSVGIPFPIRGFIAVREEGSLKKPIRTWYNDAPGLYERCVAGVKRAVIQPYPQELCSMLYHVMRDEMPVEVLLDWLREYAPKKFKEAL